MRKFWSAGWRDSHRTRASKRGTCSK